MQHRMTVAAADGEDEDRVRKRMEMEDARWRRRGMEDGGWEMER